MLNITTFAGFELSTPEAILALVLIIVYFLTVAAMIAAGIWLLIQAILAIKYPVSKKGFHRRKFILIVCAFALVSVGVMVVNGYVSSSRSSSYNSQLSVDYAKTYEHPVMLPKTLDYKIAFEQKWGQIELYSLDGATMQFKIIQVPLTAAGRKYFDIDKGNCSFEQMRENWDVPRIDDEPCKFHDSVGEFKVYKSSRNSNATESRFYAAYKDIVVKIDADSDDVMKVVADLKVTDSMELVTVFESDKFNGSYSAVLDIWRKEGRF